MGADNPAESVLERNSAIAKIRQDLAWKCDGWMAQGLLIGPKNKRLLDIAVATMLFPFATLLGFPSAPAVWLEDSHPPFFPGPRVGNVSKPDRQSKIRSMAPSAE